MPSINVKRLDHHGLVAGVFSELGFESIIDDYIGVDEQENVSPGQAVKAMVLCGLGFSQRAMMLTPQFFTNLAVDALVGPGIVAKDLNRHKLGRTLDALASKGCEGLFAVLASKACAQMKVSQDFRSIDTTSFSLTGEYDKEMDLEAVRVCHGYSKDHRPDLKQVIVELVVSQDGGIPMTMQSHSGNASDSKVFRERSKKLLDSLKESPPLKAWVGDSKLYSSQNAQYLANLPFITRIPRTVTLENETVIRAVDSPSSWQEASNGKLSYQSFDVTHYDIEQRWIVAMSKEGLKRSQKTVLKAALKESEHLKKALFHFQAQRFACVADAEKAFKNLQKKVKFHQFETPTWTEHKQHKGAGRPAKDALPEKVMIQGTATFTKLSEAIERAINIKATFVIAATVPKEQCSDEEVIQTYKAQSSVETGFRFLKDPIFFTSSFFLKKTERIQALLMIMTIALLIYTIAQKRIRARLVETNTTWPNQIRKPVQNPTLRWVFQCFEGINYITVDGEISVDNITQNRLEIIRLLDFKEIESIYQISTA